MVTEWKGRSELFLPGEFHGRRNLAGYTPWGRKELDTTERLHFHFPLFFEGKADRFMMDQKLDVRERGQLRVI